MFSGAVAVLAFVVVFTLPALLYAEGTANPTVAPNSDPIYQQLRQAGLSGETFAVTNVTLKRDVGNFILKTGTLYFLTPVAGKVTGAVFIGEGVFQMSPFFPWERKSLSLLTKDPEGVINEEFNQLVLRFTDDTFAELKRHGSVNTGTADAHASDVLNDIRATLRHKINYNLDGRILEDVLSTQPGGLFVAFIKGRKYSGKMIFAVDPQGISDLLPLPVQPEEVALATYDEAKLGVWCAMHLMEEYKTGEARGNQQNGVIADVSQNLDTSIERNGKLTGVAITEVKSLRDGVRVVPFDLYKSLRVQSVKDASGQDLNFIQENKEEDPQFFVILPKPVGRGEKLLIKTAYEGKEAVSNESGGNYFPNPAARASWYPNTRFGDYANYTMTFRIPKGLTLVASGAKTSESNDGSQNVTVWHSEALQAVAGFNFGGFKMESAKNDKLGFAFESYANKEEPNMFRDLQYQLEAMEREGIRSETTLNNLTTTGLSKKALAEAQLSIDIYTNYFGPLPYKRIAMTQQTAMGFGQSWPSLVYLPITSFLDSTIRHQLGFDETKGFFKTVASHEVAHQWWGHAVGFDSYRDQWMSEGFAEFSASLFVQVIQKNPKEFIKFWDDEKTLLTEKNNLGFRAIDVGPVTMGYRLSNSRSGMGITRRLIYPKGAYILHMIRMMMWDRRTGDQNFIEMMHDFVKTYQNRDATTEDFKAEVEKYIAPGIKQLGNGTMDWFFDEYVYGTALPHYQFDQSIGTNAQNQPVLKVKLTQSEVNDNFVMLVPIYLELADGRVVRLGSARIIGNSSFEQEVPLGSLKEKPRRALINYLDDVLCTQ
ncbi:MAG: M1 family aminopeptidase [Acidobacteriia bacterium]|nr:M1 family aminopeptidase [Terriglobia bacterium]